MKSLIIIILASYAVKCDDDASYYVVEVPAAETKEHKPFRVYWNVPTMQCKSKNVPFENLHEKYGIIQNTDDSFRGDEIAILYDPGIFPALLKNETSGKYKFRNGGVPQEGDLEKHWKAFKKVLEQSIPDPDFSGIGIIDFESWRPIFRQNFGILIPYKDFSYQIERKQHWFWPEKAIQAKAKLRFEEAARSFMQTTLVIAKELRPFARWGYYAFPYCFNMSPNNPYETCPSQVQEENDKTNWLWQESTALYPSTYFSRGVSGADMARSLRGRIAEAARLRRTAPILPYFWFRYRDGGFLPQAKLDVILDTFNTSQASGFIIWGSSSDVNTVEKCKNLLQYTEDILGPSIAKYTKQHDAHLNKVRPVTQPPKPGLTTWRPILRDQLANNTSNNSFDQNSTQNWFVFNNSTQEPIHTIKHKKDTNKTNNVNDEDKYLLHIKRNTLLELLFNILLYKEMENENNDTVDYDEDIVLPQESTSDKNSNYISTESWLSNTSSIVNDTSSTVGYTTNNPISSTAKLGNLENENIKSHQKENLTQYVNQNYYNVNLYASEFPLFIGDEKSNKTSSIANYSTVSPLSKDSTNENRLEKNNSVESPILFYNLMNSPTTVTSTNKFSTEFTTESNSTSGQTYDLTLNTTSAQNNINLETTIKLQETTPFSLEQPSIMHTESSTKSDTSSDQTYDVTLNKTLAKKNITTESTVKLDETTPVSLEQPSLPYLVGKKWFYLYEKSIPEMTSSLPVTNVPSSTTESNNVIKPTVESNVNQEPIYEKKNETAQTNMNQTSLYDIEDEINKSFYATKNEKKSYHDESSSDRYTSLSSLIMPINKETPSTVSFLKSDTTEHLEEDSDYVTTTEAIIITSASNNLASNFLSHKTFYNKEAKLSSPQIEDDDEEDSDSGSSTESIKIFEKLKESKMPLLLTKDEKKSHHRDNSVHDTSTETIITTSEKDESTPLQQTLDDKETENDETSDSLLSYTGSSTEPVLIMLWKGVNKFSLSENKDESKSHYVTDNVHDSSTEVITTSDSADTTEKFSTQHTLDDIETHNEEDSDLPLPTGTGSSTEAVIVLLKKDEDSPVPLTKVKKESHNVDNITFNSSENLKPSFHEGKYENVFMAPFNNDIESTSELPLLQTKIEKKGHHIPNLDLIFYTDSAVIPLRHNESEYNHDNSDLSSSTNTLHVSASEVPVFQDKDEINDNNLYKNILISPTSFIKIPGYLNEITYEDPLLEKTKEDEMQNAVVTTTDRVQTSTITFSSNELPSKDILPKVILDNIGTTDTSNFDVEPKIIAEPEGSTDPSVKMEETIDNGDETYQESEGGERFLAPVKKVIVTKSIHRKFEDLPKNNVDDSLDSSTVSIESFTNKSINNMVNSAKNDINPTAVLSSTKSVR